MIANFNIFVTNVAVEGFKAVIIEQQTCGGILCSTNVYKIQTVISAFHMEIITTTRKIGIRHYGHSINDS